MNRICGGSRLERSSLGLQGRSVIRVRPLATIRDVHHAAVAVTVGIRQVIIVEVEHVHVHMQTFLVRCPQSEEWYTIMLPLLALVHAWLVPPRAGLVRVSHAQRRADLAAMCDMMPAINFSAD